MKWACANVMSSYQYIRQSDLQRALNLGSSGPGVRMRKKNPTKTYHMEEITGKI